MKGNSTKLCAYLPACAKALKASGPMSGSSRSFPKVIFSPVKARTTKDTAVSQCEKRSKALKRDTFLPARPAEIRICPRHQITERQDGDHAEDHDRAEPVQCDFVKIIPQPAGGLHRARVLSCREWSMRPSMRGACCSSVSCFTTLAPDRSARSDRIALRMPSCSATASKPQEHQAVRGHAVIAQDRRMRYLHVAVHS